MCAEITLNAEHLADAAEINQRFNPLLFLLPVLFRRKRLSKLF